MKYDRNKIVELHILHLCLLYISLVGPTVFVIGGGPTSGRTLVFRLNTSLMKCNNLSKDVLNLINRGQRHIL